MAAKQFLKELLTSGWRSQLLDASFRGVKFFVSGHQYGVGRRNVVHQYPLRENPYVEDMGMDADEFTIEGYIVQRKENAFNYFVDRNNLIKALKTKGPGLLVHPFLGNQTVNVVGKTTIREDFREGGIVRFTMSFVIAGSNRYPAPQVSPKDNVDKAADAAENYFLDSFGSDYTLEDQPSWVKDSMQSDTESLFKMTKSTLNSVQGGLESAVNAAKQFVGEQNDEILDKILYPCQIGGSIINSIRTFLGIVNLEGSRVIGKVYGTCSDVIRATGINPDSAVLPIVLGSTSVGALMHIAGNAFGDDTGQGADTSLHGGSLVPITVTTPSRARQAGNRIFLVNLARNESIAIATRIAVRIDYNGYDDLTTVLEKITDAMDTQLLKLGNEAASEPYKDYGVRIGDNSSYSALEQLRREFVKSMVEIGATLAQTVDYDVSPYGENALNLAYGKYNDLDRATEIFKRNQIPKSVDHPGFLPGNESVSILNV
jgi:prophage DNA circulation protein